MMYFLLIRKISPYTAPDILLGVFDSEQAAQDARNSYLDRYRPTDRKPTINSWFAQIFPWLRCQPDTNLKPLPKMQLLPTICHQISLIRKRYKSMRSNPMLPNNNLFGNVNTPYKVRNHRTQKIFTITETLRPEYSPLPIIYVLQLDDRSPALQQQIYDSI
jgi:hypothetical protein